MSEQTDERVALATITDNELAAIRNRIFAYNRTVNAAKMAIRQLTDVLPPRMVVYHRAPGDPREEGVAQPVWTYQSDGEGKLTTGVAMLIEVERPTESMIE